MKYEYSLVLIAAAVFVSVFGTGGAMAHDTPGSAGNTLPAAQAEALQVFRPNSSVIKSCSTVESRVAYPVALVGLRVHGSAFAESNLEPVALSKSGSRFKARSINADIAKDTWARDPIAWRFGTGGKTTDAGIKCYPDMAKDPDLTDGKGKLIGHAPFFKLDKKDVGSLVCFGTSETYNSWDCVAFSSSEKRYRLWYRQQMAD